MVSDGVLAITGIWVFLTYFQHLSWYNRLLWGFFFLTISMTSLIGVLTYAGIQSFAPLHHSLEILAGSLGVVCVVVGVWTLILRQAVSRLTFMTTVGLGLILFVTLLSPEMEVFAPIVPSFSMVIVMLIAFLGLLRRDPRASWIIFGVMILALSTKIKAGDLPIHPVDFYHYILALAFVFFGKAARGPVQRA